MNFLTFFSALRELGEALIKLVWDVLSADIHVGQNRSPSGKNALILFPFSPNTFFCGLAGILSYQKAAKESDSLSLDPIETLFHAISQKKYAVTTAENRPVNAGIPTG